MNRPLHGSRRCGCGNMTPARPDALEPSAVNEPAREEALYSTTPEAHDCPADRHGVSIAPRSGEEEAWILVSGAAVAS
jgi:hypothetical protein